MHASKESCSKTPCVIIQIINGRKQAFTLENRDHSCGLRWEMFDRSRVKIQLRIAAKKHIKPLLLSLVLS